MCRFFTINTLTERVPFGYANAEFSSAESSRTLACFGESEDDYDDDEDYEKEWCD